METIFIQLLPLYACIVLGFVAGRWLGVDRQSVAAIAFYILLPMVILSGVMQIEITLGALLLPAVLFIVATGMCGVAYYLSGLKWRDKNRNILALAGGSGNTGYFGVPVSLMVLPPEQAGIYVMALLGMTLYENSVGYYVTARGQHGARESFLKMIRLPSLYAFLLGLVLNLAAIELPQSLMPFADHARGAYSIMGMMMIGLGLATLKSVRFDFSFISFAFLMRFMIWPLVALGVIQIDLQFLYLFTPAMHSSIFIVSIVPIAANTVVIATLLKAEPEKIASAVLFSTLVALVSVPVMLAWYLS